MQAKRILTALKGPRLRRDLRRAVFTLVAFLVIAVPSSRVIDGRSTSSIGDAAAQGLEPWGDDVDDEDLFGDDELLFGDEGGDIFDPDGGELDFVDFEIDEPFPDDVEDNGFAPEEVFFYDEEISENLTADGIPLVAVQAYQGAAAASGTADPGCGIPWYLLAAIGRVESDHGRFGGSRLLMNGDGTIPIRGLPLDGRPGLARIDDTDGGALDGDTTFDRAVGPMQFIPSTWRSVMVDGNRDGSRNPNNIFDATLGAAGYLCSGPGNLRDPVQQAAAVRRYNHTDEYVRVVMGVAAQYADQSAGQPPVPQPGPGPTPPPASPPRTPPAPRPPVNAGPRPTTPTPTTQPPAPAPPTTQPPATPPTTVAPGPEVPDPGDPTEPVDPTAPTPPGTPDPDGPTAPDVPGPDVPEDGVPTDPTQDDAPVDPELPPAAVGWSGTMLEFVGETLTEREQAACAEGTGDAIAVPAPEAGAPAGEPGTAECVAPAPEGAAPGEGAGAATDDAGPLARPQAVACFGGCAEGPVPQPRNAITV